MNKRLATIGLCRKAGKLVMGFDAVMEEVRSPGSKVGGVLLASDLSEKTKKEVRFGCAAKGTEVAELAETLDDIRTAAGKRAGVLAVLDKGLYDSIIKSNEK